MKKLLMLIMFVLLSFTVFGGQCFENGDCYIYHDVLDNTTFDSVKLSVSNVNGTLIYDDVDMELQEDRLYFYIARFEFQGTYNASISVLNNSVEQYNTSYNFDVAGTNSLRVGRCPTSTSGVLVLFLIVGMALFFLVYGFSGSQISGIFGSLIFLVSSWFVYGCSSILGFIIGSLGLILLAGFTLGAKE